MDTDIGSFPLHEVNGTRLLKVCQFAYPAMALGG